MNRFIDKGVANGRVAVPPSKSYAHRLLIASALSMGRCTVSNVGFSDDVLVTLDALKGMGYNYRIVLDSVCFEKPTLRDPVVLQCGESGSSLRMLMPVALVHGGHFRFEGSERLFERGVGVYEKVFDGQGINYRKGNGWIEVKGRLHSGNFQVDASVSSQFVSGLLFVLPLLDGDSTLELAGKVVSRPYIEMTLDVLHRFGIVVEELEGSFFIPGNQKYNAVDSVVEGDCSNATFLEAFNLLGGNVEVTGLNPDTIQGDRIYREHFKALSQGFAHINLTDCIDLGPILFTMAALLNGAVFTGTRRLAIKESDRISCMLEELSKFGATFVVSDDEVRIDACTLHAPEKPLNGHDDHRIVMALSVLLSRFGGVINGAEAVGKSFPSFFGCLERLGLKTEAMD